MSEAHARMHLRNHVIQEDVDMAIRVLLDSFISTQKFGVQKALQKNFTKYMIFKKDSNGIVLHLLRGLVEDTLQLEEIVTGSTSNLSHVDVKVEELQSKALDYGISDLKAFFSSTEFSNANFELDEESSFILTFSTCVLNSIMSEKHKCCRVNDVLWYVPVHVGKPYTADTINAVK
ncbi:DNA helicase [Salvia divinorum]